MPTTPATPRVDFELAASAWPRTGGDRAQSGRSPLPGPVEGRVVQEHDLGLPAADRPGGGLVLGDDGDLRVTWRSRVLRVNPTTGVVWSRALPGERTLAPPLALAAGETLTVLDGRAWQRWGADGELLWSRRTRDPIDTDGSSPNLTRAGRVVLVNSLGALWLQGARRRTALGAFGYDLPMPALYEDGSMAVAGYAGTGLVRIAASGQVLWRAPLRDADLLPAIDADGVVATGSLNERCSLFVASDGAVCGRYGAAATFASASGGDWYARSRDALARVSRTGEVRWVVSALSKVGLMFHGGARLLRDVEDRVYALDGDRLLACGPTGDVVFQVELPAEAHSLGPTASGELAVLLESGGLVIVR